MIAAWCCKLFWGCLCLWLVPASITAVPDKSGSFFNPTFMFQREPVCTNKIHSNIIVCRNLVSVTSFLLWFSASYVSVLVQRKAVGLLCSVTNGVFCWRHFAKWIRIFVSFCCCSFKILKVERVLLEVPKCRVPIACVVFL